uniref:Uncharacterized protein n=1 Tax=Tanacetum cinerariifolium TaxID=118510 RepID=A0A6L2JFL7_TANCI|nr:hypothetical protein [Tanacetum cinerariifolium]
MDNTQSVFDAKVTIRGTLHTLTSIKELLGQSVNERRRTRPKSSISDVFHGQLSVVETSKKEALSKEFDPKKYDKNVDEYGDGKGSESEIISVLTGQVSCDKYKGDYGALFAEWSNPIPCMAPTSTELLQLWLIRSLDYFQTLLVDGQPNCPITASPQGIQPIICDAVVHDPQFEKEPKQVVESVPLFTSEELVAEYHSITTSVQLIKNVGDGDPSIVLKELAAVKQRLNAIERFIKSRNDNLSEDSLAKQSVEKEIKYSNGKVISV